MSAYVRVKIALLGLVDMLVSFSQIQLGAKVQSRWGTRIKSYGVWKEKKKKDGGMATWSQRAGNSGKVLGTKKYGRGYWVKDRPLAVLGEESGARLGWGKQGQKGLYPLGCIPLRTCTRIQDSQESVFHCC